VRFKVLPKSVWETQQRQERSEEEEDVAESSKLPAKIIIERDDSDNLETTIIPSEQANEQKSKISTVLMANMKRKKSSSRSDNPSQGARKKLRISEQQEIPRPPFDVPESPGGNLRMDLSMVEKKTLDKLLILDDEGDDHNSKSDNPETSMSEVTLGFFGGLQHVGQTNHMIQNTGACNDRAFLARGADKITRRKEKVSIQERLDPNRRQTGRVENPEKQKSKVLRTEDWFDEQKKSFDFDLGWSLLEITAGGNQKRLCAFSSMEICLGDNDS